MLALCFLILGTLYSWSLILYGTSVDPLSRNPHAPTASVNFTSPTSTTTTTTTTTTNGVKESATTSPRSTSKTGRWKLVGSSFVLVAKRDQLKSKTGR